MDLDTILDFVKISPADLALTGAGLGLGIASLIWGSQPIKVVGSMAGTVYAFAGAVRYMDSVSSYLRHKTNLKEHGFHFNKSSFEFRSPSEIKLMYRACLSEGYKSQVAKILSE